MSRKPSSNWQREWLETHLDSTEVVFWDGVICIRRHVEQKINGIDSLTLMSANREIDLMPVF